jgi:F420-dependent oxidoreductase-like protein
MMSTKLKIGIFGGDTSRRSIDEIVADAATAHEEGFATYWLPQVFGQDALALLGLIGREVPGIELGTAVVPTYARHPMTMAQQALTAQAMSGGRLVLGIGLSHQLVVEGMWGLSYDRPVRHMREYLTVLDALVHTGTVAFAGETLHVNGSLAVEGAAPMPILLAALGPKMLELAGGSADGTITWMTGPATIADHVVPAITGAAETAGRPAPRVVVGLPICVTDDVEAQRERAARIYQMYGSLPSYRAMLDREGAADPSGVVIVGNEDSVRVQLEHLAAIGATDLVAAEFAKPGTPERERTRELLRSM